MTYKMKTLMIQNAESAPEGAKPLLQQAKSQMGFVPNMYGAMANQPALLKAYTSAYAAFRAEAGFAPAEQEVIFLTISRDNGCEYCVAAHSLVADAMSNVPLAVTNAIRDGKPAPDAKLGALATFTSSMVSSRGNPSDAEVSAFLEAGFDEKHILGIILAISVKTISNYTNHVFHTPVDSAFAGRTWSKT